MVRQHTLVMAWKAVKLEAPQHIADSISIQPNGSINTTAPRQMNTAQSLRWRMCAEWNQLPQHLKETNSLPRFKTRNKKWIKDSRPPIPPDPGLNTS